MTDLATIQTEDLRLRILMLLANGTQYSASDALLVSTLPNFGHNVAFDRLNAELAWLEQQGMLSIHIKGVKIAVATQRGLDVAKGRAYCPGVRQPGPEDL